MVGILDGSVLFSQLALFHPYSLLQSHHLHFKALLLPAKSHRPLPLHGCCCPATPYPILPTAPSPQTTLLPGPVSQGEHHPQGAVRPCAGAPLQDQLCTSQPASPACPRARPGVCTPRMPSLPQPVTHHKSDLAFCQVGDPQRLRAKMGTGT